jgi:squalene synthase HpnC
MAVGHYENFPVASLLLPARLRAPVRAIYRFARTADDVADEGNAPAPMRLLQLDALAAQLDRIEHGDSSDWPDLAVAVHEFDLPIAPLRDLLSAFRQDVTVARYADYAALLDYCRRSANPVGHLMLVLFGRREAQLRAWSDAICTGLQLVNFWQDVAMDWGKGRVYLPQSELVRFGLTERAIADQQVDGSWSAMMAAQTARARAMLESGAPLASALGARIGFELRLVIQGGLRIAARIDAAGGDVFRRRPRLAAGDWVRMWLQALRMPQSRTP